MFEQRCLGVRNARLEVRFVLPFGQSLTFDKWHDFFEDRRIAGGFDEMDHGVGQPQEVVRDSRAYAAAGGRVPPMLNVAFNKLAARRRAKFARGQSLVSRL